MEQTLQNNIKPLGTPQLQGFCLCGASKYAVTGPPIQAVVCHCRDCKKWSGGAFAANIWILKDYFKLDEASVASIRTYEDSKTDAGKTLSRVSCGECGSSLYVDIPDYGVVSVTRGTLDVEEDFEILNPKVEFYCCRKLPWVAISSGTEERHKLE